MFANYDPLAAISIHTNGSLDIVQTTPIIDHLMLSPLQLRQRYGKGRTGIYIKGLLLNGIAGQIAIQLQYKPSENIYTTAFLQELIGIVIGNHMLQDQNHMINSLVVLLLQCISHMVQY
jgi:hypothetical protein